MQKYLWLIYLSIFSIILIDHKHYKANYRLFILGGIKMSQLILVNPSKVLEEKILEYKQEYLDFEETNINGSCGLALYIDFDEWLEIVLSIEKDNVC